MMAQDFIKWNGGPRPVTGPVHIQLRNGRVTKGQAEGFSWRHIPNESDIVAYRHV